MPVPAFVLAVPFAGAAIGAVAKSTAKVVQNVMRDNPILDGVGEAIVTGASGGFAAGMIVRAPMEHQKHKHHIKHLKSSGN